MAATQNLDIVSTDLPTSIALLSELRLNTINIRKIINSLINKIQSNILETQKGLTLLQLKNHNLVSYLANLSYIVLIKLSGIPLQNNIGIDNLIETRVLLERIRPLEDKIKYQIEKYLNVESYGTHTTQDETNLVSKIEVMDNGLSENEDDSETKNSKKENNVYKVSKITQTHYPEERLEKEDKHMQRERSRALNSAMLRDILSEHTEDPEVVHNNIFKSRAVEKRRQIERYEEANFTRITLKKKDKAALKEISTPGNLASELLSFRSLDAIDGHNTTKKRKKSQKKKMKKGFKKRKTHH